MQWISNSQICVVGLGLMGGSYAMALTRLGFRVSAIDRDPEAIAYALERGMISFGTTEPDQSDVSQADGVIFALYPGVLLQWLRDWQHLLKPGALLTDVTGVKGGLTDQIQALLRPDVEFIAAHPMAGREVYGVQNADPAMFRGANYIVVPTQKNTAAAVAWCESLGRLLGFARISRLTPEEHDEMIGFVSQLTHCIAVALMTCNDNRHLVDYTGDSFRDLTRIARINETMWSELFLRNKAQLLKQMDLFAAEFQTLRDLLDREDRTGLEEKMQLSTERRSYFDQKGEKHP